MAFVGRLENANLYTAQAQYRITAAFRLIFGWRHIGCDEPAPCPSNYMPDKNGKVTL